MCESAMPASGSLREAVLAGPGDGVETGAGVGPLAVVVTPEAVRAALTAAGHTDSRRAVPWVREPVQVGSAGRWGRLRRAC
ncbi:hypothetical protein [Frankia sp. CiP3]|uniref:hypothetical protein n=1 Tax=Frankia sp. CiP3 TaxID=2880971 RepID=UPI001EF47764|nr:hypothetical protein [Frankia sp. CiP3]